MTTITNRLKSIFWKAHGIHTRVKNQVCMYQMLVDATKLCYNFTDGQGF